jgi:hypothetical protein
MGAVRSNENVRHSFFYRLEELYLTFFVLFFRISRWKGRVKAGTAASGVAIVMWVIVLSVWACVQTVTHNDNIPSRWIVGGAAFLSAIANDYYLVTLGRGVAFEKHFRDFHALKRTVLYLAAISIVVVAGTAFYLSTAAYHRLLGIP